MASVGAAHVGATEGSGAMTHLYTGSDDEEGDSSILADLASMFPAVEHSELVAILRSHGGDLDATVDYLMALSLHTETEGTTNNIVRQGLMQVEESYGQFSDEIGGLPEVLPSFMSSNQTDSDSDEEEEEGGAPGNHGGNGIVENGEEALPSSYNEATQRERGEGYVVAGCIMLPITAVDRQSALMDGKSVGATSPQLKQPRSHKKHKRPKKLQKLAGKLNVRKNRCLDYKAEQEKHIGEPAYQPLLPPQANEEDSREIETVNNTY